MPREDLGVLFFWGGGHCLHMDGGLYEAMRKFQEDTSAAYIMSKQIRA